MSFRSGWHVILSEAKNLHWVAALPLCVSVPQWFQHPAQIMIKPWRIPSVTASVRLPAPSLPMMDAT